MTKAVLEVLNIGTFPPKLNHTLITLITKKKNCQHVSDYRPISLCNVLYKFVLKVIVNRLKLLLSDIIFESQCAFVGDWLINDNVLVAYEVVNYLHNKRYGKRGNMSVKLDMSKTYGRVEWSFLKNIILRLGFASSFVNLILGCIKTVSFSVLINGVAKGPIFPTRKIRQGDPLSPYLFLFCTEGLISLLRDPEVSVGVRICCGAPMITHLLFTDDNLLFFRTNVETTRAV